jgi:hypothetical protein
MHCCQVAFNVKQQGKVTDLNVWTVKGVESIYNAHAMQHWGCPELTELHKGAGSRAASAQPQHISVVLTNHSSPQRHRTLQPFRAVTDYLRQPLEQHRSPSLYAPHTSNCNILTSSASQTLLRKHERAAMSLSVLTLNIWGLWLVSKKREERVK